MSETQEAKIILSHGLVPKHSVISEKKVEELLTRFGLKKEDLPKMLAGDPVAKAIGAKEGDVVEVKREDSTGKNSMFRLVISG